MNKNFRIMIDDKKIIKNYSVDLHKINQSLQLIASCYIEYDEKTRLFGLLGRLPKGYYRLSVVYTNNDKLVVGKNARLFLLKYGSKTDNSLIVNAESNKVDFQLYFDPNQIVDCLEVESSSESSYELKYKILLSTLSGEVICSSKDEEINISIGRDKSNAPIFEFEGNSNGNDLTYSLNVDKPIEIGSIKVRHSGRFLRCPECNVTFDISVSSPDYSGRNVEVRDLVFMKGEAVQSHFRVSDEGGHYFPEGKDPSDFTASIDRSRGKLKHLYVNKSTPFASENDNTVSIPLFWDMTKVLNPSSDYVDYKLHIKADYFSGLNESGKVYYDIPMIRLKRNMVLMDLAVALSDGSKEEIIENGIPASQRVPEMISGAITEYSVVLKNTAQSAEKGKEDAKVYIRDFDLSLPVSKPDYYTETIKGSVNDKVFVLKDEIVQQMSIGINYSRVFTFEYDHTCIDKIYSDNGSEAYERVIKIPLEFHYYVDKDAVYNTGDEIPQDKWIHFVSSVQILMRKEPKPEWLCVDYGTSAVVASWGEHMHDEHGHLQNRLIGLKTAKSKKVGEWYKGDKNMRRDETEDSEFLITSTAVINNVKNQIGDEHIEAAIQNIENYVDSPIWLSPTSGMVDIYSRMLPSLKTLIGNKDFPQQLLPSQVRAVGKISVDKLFELVYKQLFTHFLPNLVKETNKLVLTVPNTYAPCHIEILKKLAFASLKNLRPDYLRFISESDAVAFYYLSKRPDYVRNASINLNDDYDKNVLVYDMGAGTLDLTYFVKTEKVDKTCISIEGKMGVAKAGNYLDYLIAEIIVKALKDKIQNPKLWNNLNELLELKSYQNRDSEAAGALKHYVRDVVKPMLNSDEYRKLPDLTLFNNDIPTRELTIGDIVNHKDFESYLSEVSDNVFEHFKYLFTDDEHEVKPTMVIFSGRTTCIRRLREAVRDALVKNGMVHGRCLYLDLSSGCISDNVETDGNEVSSLKTAVVNGAMAFCADFYAGKGDFVLRNKNVFAQYGVIFKTGNGWEWENLIDVHTMPINGENAKLTEDGMTIYEYNSSVFDASEANGAVQCRSRQRNFSGVSAVYVVQSYSKRTAQDWTNENREMISVIGYLDLSNVDGDKTYKLTIDSGNQLHFYVGSAQMPLLAHDEWDTPCFQKSMWPIVRYNI